MPPSRIDSSPRRFGVSDSFSSSSTSLHSKSYNSPLDTLSSASSSASTSTSTSSSPRVSSTITRSRSGQRIEVDPLSTRSSPPHPESIRRTTRSYALVRGRSPSPPTRSIRPTSVRRLPSSQPSFPVPFHPPDSSSFTRPTPSCPVHSMTSFFSHSVNLLAPRVEVVLDNQGVVDMVGGVNTGTSYSLTGHVIISMPTLPIDMQERQRELRHLTVTMEGKAEYFDEESRYTPMRLYTTTITLASPDKPLILPAASADLGRRVQYAVSFDFRLPGWLPPSHTTAMSTTAHGLVSNCLIGWAKSTTSPPTPSSTPFEPQPSAYEQISFVNALSEAPLVPLIRTKSRPCIKIQPKPYPKTRSTRTLFPSQSLHSTATEKHTTKWQEFTIRRHKVPVSIDGSQEIRTIGSGDRTFSLRPVGQSHSPVECIVTVPEWVDVNGDDKGLKITLRMKARRGGGGLDVVAPATSEDVVERQEAAEGDGIPREERDGEGDVSMSEGVQVAAEKEDEILTRITELGMEVEERELFSSNPYPSFLQTFPLPTPQPTRGNPINQLLSPTPTLDHLIQPIPTTPKERRQTRQCLLADDGNQRNFFFDGDGLCLSEDKYRKVNVCLPMSGARAALKNLSPGGKPQTEMDGPFLKIRHTLKIRVVCQTGDVHDPHETVVILSTPIRFGSCPATSPPITSSSCIPSIFKSEPAPRLPAYIQLFYENGDLRECDPLPLYSSIMREVETVPQSPAPAYKTFDDGPASVPLLAPSPAAVPMTRMARTPIPERRQMNNTTENDQLDQERYNQGSSSRSTSPTREGEGEMMDIEDSHTGRNLESGDNDKLVRGVMSGVTTV